MSSAVPGLVMLQGQIAANGHLARADADGRTLTGGRFMAMSGVPVHLVVDEVNRFLASR